MTSDRASVAAKIAMIMIVLLLTMLMCSCRTTSGCEISYDRMVDTVYMNHVQKDSIYLHDSIYTREYLKGDTVCQYMYKETIKYVDKFRHDTTYIAKRDTVYRYIKTTVTKKATLWSRIKSGLAVVGLFCLIASAFVIFVIYNNRKRE